MTAIKTVILKELLDRLNSFWEKNINTAHLSEKEIVEINSIISEIHERAFKIVTVFDPVREKKGDYDIKNKTADEIMDILENHHQLIRKLSEEIKRNHLLIGKSVTDIFFLIDANKKEIYYSPVRNDFLNHMALSSNGNVPPKNISEPRRGLT